MSAVVLSPDGKCLVLYYFYGKLIKEKLETHFLLGDALKMELI
jgi:hypothetical protein